MNKEAIKSILKTTGWIELRKMLEEESQNLRLAKNISKKKSYQDIAIEVLGKAYACKIIDRWLRKVDSISNGQLRAEKPSFK